MMTERSIRMPFIKSRDPFVMVPGGASIPWPPQDDQYTDQAKRALAFAQDEAARLNHNHIGEVHILVGAVRVEDGLPARIFADLGVTSTSCVTHSRRRWAAARVRSTRATSRSHRMGRT